MNRRAALLLALCAAAGMQAAVADTDPAANPLAHAAPGGDLIRGRFEQDKYLAELERPLTSSGRFVAAHGRGLLWRVEQPFATTLVIDSTHLVQRVDGRQTLRLDRDQQPGLRVVAAVLVAVFQADIDRLRDFFSIENRPVDGNGWRLALQPTTAGVSAFVSRLTLSGTDELERIEIDQPGGDRSVIHLQFASAPIAPLTAAERSEFGD